MGMCGSGGRWQGLRPSPGKEEVPQAQCVIGAQEGGEGGCTKPIHIQSKGNIVPKRLKCL